MEKLSVLNFFSFIAVGAYPLLSIYSAFFVKIWKAFNRASGEQWFVKNQKLKFSCQTFFNWGTHNDKIYRNHTMDLSRYTNLYPKRIEEGFRTGCHCPWVLRAANILKTPKKTEKNNRQLIYVRCLMYLNCPIQTMLRDKKYTYIICIVEKPAETQTNIQLASHLVRVPNSWLGGNEFESPVWTDSAH